MNETEFQEQKLAELILLVSEFSKDDPKFGDVKLNKLLFFSDFLAYTHLGAPITGVPYQKLERGPTPRRLVPVRNDLLRRNALRCEKRGDVGPYQRNVIVPLRPANTTLFSPQQLAVVKKVIKTFKHDGATSISDISHRAPGWNLVGMKETIPYSSALIRAAEPSDAAIALGRELAAQHGW